MEETVDLPVAIEPVKPMINIFAACVFCSSSFGCLEVEVRIEVW